MTLEDIMSRGRSQTQKATSRMILVKGTMDPRRHTVDWRLSGPGGGAGPLPVWDFSWGQWNGPGLIVAMVVQLCERTKSHWIVHCKRVHFIWFVFKRVGADIVVWSRKGLWWPHEMGSAPSGDGGGWIAAQVTWLLLRAVRSNLATCRFRGMYKVMGSF